MSTAATTTIPTNITHPNPPTTQSRFHSPPIIKHNPHPYPIKTTSGGILTRSNSSGNNTHNARNRYVPSSPSPSPSRHRFSNSVDGFSNSNSVDGVSNSVGYTGYPAPPPIPVPMSSGEESDTPGKTKLVRRRSKIDAFEFPKRAASPEKVDRADDLPQNPKHWTPQQLSTYLTTALKSKDGSALPLPAIIASDIAAFVRQARLGGRAFLRLTETDLEEMGVSNVWRSALLSASKDLRGNLLRGQIWGFGHSAEPSDDELSSAARERKDSRVRRMVATLERSASMSSTSSSGFLSHSSSRPRSRAGSVVVDSSDDEMYPRSSPEVPVTPLEDVDGELTVKEILAREDLEEDGELSMAELLKNAAEAPEYEELSWGARAWAEADGTMKHVPSPDATVPPAKAKVVGRGGSSKRKPRVTARKVSNPVNVEDLFGAPMDSLAVALSTPLPADDDVLVVEKDAALDIPLPEDDAGLIEPVNEGPTDKEIIAILQARVHDVEARLKEMEASEASRQLSATPAVTESIEIPQFYPSPFSRPAEPKSEPEAGLEAKERMPGAEPEWDVEREDTFTLRSLPSYVVLVSFGVCLVVTSTVVRTLTGRRV